MTIKRIHSGGPFEKKVGYCRVVVAGGWVYVAGTCAHSDDMPSGVVGQCASALGVIKKALQEADTEMAHVVRVVYYMADMREFEMCWPLLREAFGENPPAATVIEAKLIDPEDRIEIEVTAILQEQAR